MVSITLCSELFDKAWLFGPGGKEWPTYNMHIVIFTILLPISVLCCLYLLLCISIGNTDCPMAVLEAIKHCTNLVKLE